MPKGKPIDFKINENGCYIVTSHKPGWKGYVLFQRGEMKTRLHRFVYEQMKGEIPKGLVVRHTCDTPNCIAPDHLILGTPAENSADMVKRGRSIQGEKHVGSVLTEIEVRTIFDLLDHGFRHADIAESFGVHRRTVYDIQQGRTWKHLKLFEGVAVK